MISRKTYALYVIGGAFICIILSVHVWRAEQYRSSYEQIIRDIAFLQEVFTKIDTTCGIYSFDFQQNPINFLTIKKDGFIGSQVGSLNLKYPDKWEGPYVNINPTSQGKEYLIVKTKQGIFITPGIGVQLKNRKRIGIDIQLTYETDIYALTQEGKELNFQKQPLARPVVLQQNKVTLARIAGEE